MRQHTRQTPGRNIFKTEGRALRVNLERVARQDTQNIPSTRRFPFRLAAYRPLRSMSGLLLGVCGMIACGRDAAGPTLSNTPATVYVLKFQSPAINIALTAPYDTVQLITTLQTSTGTPVTDTSTVQYLTQDSAIVISPTGLVTARFPTNQAQVVAIRTVHGVTLTDTALIQVTQTPFAAPLASLSIQPQPGGLDSARVYRGFFRPPVVSFFATIATGDPATDTICRGKSGCNTPLLVKYASSDPTIADISSVGRVIPHREGRVVFTISTLAYGVHKVDSLSFSVGYSQNAVTDITIDSSKHPPVEYAENTDLHQVALYGVGLQLGIGNDATETFIVTLPVPAHGVHFLDVVPRFRVGTDNLPDPAQPSDTVPSCVTDCSRNLVYVQFDSVGTYVLHYHGLESGITFTDTLMIYPYP